MFFERHRATLDAAVAAIDARGYWSAYPEAPSGKIYGETANDDAKKAFEAQLGQPFALDQVASGTVGGERSPYGFDLKIAYPRLDIETAFRNAAHARTSLRKAGTETRVGVCLEILARLNRMSFEIAYAVMHTTGQGFVMAFQAGGPHAQDRGLEAVATAWREMSRVPAHARWEKPQGKNPPLVLDKDYRIVPKGIALAIGCATFPTWNTYPAIFANLATGNPTLVKPHPAATLPLAMTVRVARTVLTEAGLDPDAVQLMADGIYAPLAQTLAKRPELAIIDYTGGSDFGDWLSKNAGHATIFAEKAGTNAVDRGKYRQREGHVPEPRLLAQPLFGPDVHHASEHLRAGHRREDARRHVMSSADFGAQLGLAIDKLLGDPARAAEVLGAIQNQATLGRIEMAARQGKVVRASAAMAHPNFADATVRTPLVVALDESQSAIYGQEMFGPVAYLVTSADPMRALDAAFGSIAKKGAITAAVYSTDAAFLAAAEERAADAGVALSENLTGGVFVNQSAAFSDYHATGCNPAANASLTDAGFVTPRFHVAQVRRTAAATVPA